MTPWGLSDQIQQIIETSAGNPITATVNSALAQILPDNMAAIVHRNSALTKALHLKEASAQTTFPPPTDMFIVPLVSAEIGPNDPEMPSALKDGGLMSIRAGYPVAEYAAQIPYGKNMYDALYKKLKKSKKFKFVFEYVLPMKRALALNTMYGIVNFQSFFTDPCAFDGVFDPTRRGFLNIIDVASQDRSKTFDYKDRGESGVDAAFAAFNADSDIPAAKDAQRVCAPGALALSKFLNPPKKKLVSILDRLTPPEEE